MKNQVTIILPTLLWLASALVGTPNASACEGTEVSSVEEARQYLQTANSSDSANLPCIELAFKTIAGSPHSQAAPIFLDFLSFKRPLSEAEQHGIFMHGNDALSRYPAAQALIEIGSAADPFLVRYLAANYRDSNIASSNALHTLGLIHHGDAIEVVRILSTESKAATDNSAAANLRSAAKTFAEEWCLGNLRSKCQAILTR